jgi:hypothetical protein
MLLRDRYVHSIKLCLYSYSIQESDVNSHIDQIQVQLEIASAMLTALYQASEDVHSGNAPSDAPSSDKEAAEPVGVHRSDDDDCVDDT